MKSLECHLVRVWEESGREQEPLKALEKRQNSKASHPAERQATPSGLLLTTKVYANQI